MKIIIETDKKNLNKYNENEILTPQSNLKYVNIDKLSNDYINFVGDLNKKYNSIIWWTCSIGSRNQYVSNLYKNICYYIEIIERIKHFNKDIFYVMIDNKFLIKQLKMYCKQNKIEYIILNNIKLNIKFFFTYLYLLVLNFITTSKKIKYKYLTEKNLGKQIRKRLKNKEYYILRTGIDKRSFNNNQYDDIYYGKLVDYIQKKINLIILCVIYNSFKKNLDKIKYNNIHNNYLIIPIYFFIKYIDIFKLFFLQWIIFFQLKIKLKQKNIKFDEYHIYYLFKQEIIDNLFNGEYKNNLLYYFVAKNIGKKINCKFFTFPYENHSWEKLIILSFKKYSHNTFIIGYQHSSISKSLFNYFLCKDESKIIPLPHKIITVGNESIKIMEKYGNFPINILSKGCALRYEYIFNKKIKNNNKFKNVLMILPGNFVDSINLLKFLLTCFKNESLFSIKIKYHPVFPIEKILSKGKFDLPEHFNIENRNIDESLNDADIVLYSNTTACIEALMLGIPVIFININNYYNEDRLFNCNYLKWSIQKKNELFQSIHNICNMNKIEFKNQQKLAQKYVKNYFSPISDERLDEFTKTF